MAGNSNSYFERVFTLQWPVFLDIVTSIFTEYYCIILGITWAASAVENESQTFAFNIYESSLDYELINCIDSIGKLNF